MKKLFAALFIMAVFQFLCAQDEPVTNEDKMEENAGKEEAVVPAEEPAPAAEPASQQETAVKEEPAAQPADEGGSKFQRFVNRKGKKALAGVKIGPEIFHWEGGGYGGFHFDAFFEYNFIKNFGLQAELDFGGGWYSAFKLPIIAQGNIPINDMLWLNAGAGIYIAAGYWGGFDMGLIGKVALEINTKVGVFVADIRYSPSLYYLKDDEVFGTFAILVGYAVPLPF